MKPKLSVIKLKGDRLDMITDNQSKKSSDDTETWNQFFI